MTPPMTPDRFDVLFERYLSGRLSAEESDALRACLADPAWQRRWRDLSDLDGMLGGDLRAGAPGATVPGAALHRATRSRTLRRVSRGGRPAAWPLAAAAAVILACVAILALGGGLAGRGRAPVQTVASADDARARREIADLESERARIEERLVAVERERDRLSRAGEDPAAPAPVPEAARETLARLEADRRRIEEEMARTVEAMRNARAALAGAEPAAAPPPPPPAPSPVHDGATGAVAARVERIRGEVLVTGGAEQVSARAGQGLLEAQGLRTVGGSSLAVVAWPDGTRVELDGGSEIVRLGPGPDARDTGGKRVVLGAGSLAADVAKQPPGRPMAFVTPHAEAVVRGTRLSLSVEGGATTLTVRSGRVQLVRSSDGRSVEVGAGRCATAGAGIDLSVRPVPEAAGNLALRRPATASSVFAVPKGSVVLHTPDRGNDGDESTCWGSRDNHITPDPGAWWQVDLGQPCVISRVELVARQDRYDQFAARAGFEVRGSSRPDGADAVVLARHAGPPFPQYGTWAADVTERKPFRYLRVVQTKAEYFGFAELRAFGRPGSAPGAVPPAPERER